MSLRDQKLYCDQCGAEITRITTVPGEGWAKMHNLCSKCFAAVRERALSPA